MHATHIIREAVLRVAQLRQTATDTPGLAQGLSEIKHFQARRFVGTYADLLQSPRYQLAARFFLDELYSDKDYSARDAQFARIVGVLERVFPVLVVQTAVALAQLHRLTEELDLAMAQHWIHHGDTPEAARYVMAWRSVDRRPDRTRQLATALELGRELDRLTRTPGLRLMLKMMRRPARLAGLASFQQFLESGFDTFAAMARHDDGTAYFLATVDARESQLIDLLFDADRGVCAAELSRTLGPPR